MRVEGQELVDDTQQKRKGAGVHLQLLVKQWYTRWTGGKNVLDFEERCAALMDRKGVHIDVRSI